MLHSPIGNISIFSLAHLLSILPFFSLYDSYLSVSPMHNLTENLTPDIVYFHDHVVQSFL